MDQYRKRVVYCLAAILFALPVHSEATAAYSAGELMDLSLEQLMDIEIPSSASLTATTTRTRPSAITTITAEQVRQSGARSLDELLDIYVPNFQMLRNYYSFQDIGLRGIINERDNKYLLLVNGREMNEHTEYGALSERDLPMLTDIHHIDVVRGPGSNLYGPGAIAMVINIITENAETFQGLETAVRTGITEQFLSSEVKYGRTLDDQSGLFLYAGISDYRGASVANSPLYFGYEPGTSPEDYVTPRDQQAWRDIPKLKFHVEYTHDDWTLWTRYTRGGQLWRYSYTIWEDDPRIYNGTGYQQFTIQSVWNQTISDTLNVEYSLGFDMFDYEQRDWGDFFTHREDEYTGKILARWMPDERHSLAFGTSLSYEEFGKDSPGYPHRDAYAWQVDYNFDGTMPEWSTLTYSFFAEHQYRINTQWTSFLGGRLDKNTFTDFMFSPRAVLVYAPNEKDTFKWMFTRSVRMSFAGEMKVNWEVRGEYTEPEKLDAYEFRYERRCSDKLWIAGSAFYHDHDLTGFDFWTSQYGANLGNMKTWGLELEAIYKSGQTEWIFSHGYTKLIDLALVSPDTEQLFSSDPYGFGNDIANWSNHLTKLTVRHSLTEALSVNGSLRVYWGYPGARAYQAYEMNEYDIPDVGHRIYETSVFLNLGLSWKPSDNLEVRLDGYNLMGLFDDDWNSRLYVSDWYTEARSAAPAAAVSVFYRF